MILNLCPNPSVDTYAWLKSFNTGEVNRIDSIKEYPGGKGVHVALALAENEGVSKLIGVWAGASGQWIIKACEQRKVQCDGIQLSGNNRKCYTFRSETTGLDNTELLEPGPIFTSEHWKAFKQIFEKNLAEVKLICMSGSWPKNSPKNAYAKLISKAHKKNIPSILDCTGVQLDEAVKVGFFGLHINDIEAISFCGSEDIIKLKEKLGAKVQLIALSRGENGVILSYKENIIEAKIRLENVLSTVGSGDCLTAGIAFAVEKNLSPKEIARYGVAFGAANCLSEDLGMLEKENVEKLLPLVSIKVLTNEK